jgi:hypothetical protein
MTPPQMVFIAAFAAVCAASVLYVGAEHRTFMMAFCVAIWSVLLLIFVLT